MLDIIERLRERGDSLSIEAADTILRLTSGVPSVLERMNSKLDELSGIMDACPWKDEFDESVGR